MNSENARIIYCIKKYRRSTSNREKIEKEIIYDIFNNIEEEHEKSNNNQKQLQQRNDK